MMGAFAVSELLELSQIALFSPYLVVPLEFTKLL